MAVELKFLKDRIYDKRLSEAEYKILEEREKDIDNKLVKNFNGKDAYLNYDIFDVNLITPRADIIKEILIKKYNKAGWDIKHYMGEAFGPELDYYIFSEKK